MLSRPPCSPLFPYTTLFRSRTANKLPQLGAPPERFLGSLGVTGATAYFGLLHVAQAKAGDIVFVSAAAGDRKSTRLNSSHRCISYAVFCLKKKKQHL